MPKLRKMLGSAGAPYIVALMELIETQSKTTICNWCMGYAQEHILPIYELACANDLRPRQALHAARQWLQGEIKFPVAKKFILEAHAAAREAEEQPATQAAARAIGQAAASIHVPTHSLGMCFYAAAAIAYSRVGLTESKETYDEIAAQECGHMLEALRVMAVADEPNPAKVNWRC